MLRIECIREQGTIMASDGNSHDAHAMTETAQSRFGELASPLIEEATKHAAALNGSTNPEVLHKLRVALRRLRTLFWAYRPLLNDDFDTRQRALFKYLATSAGSVRDWDILLKLLNELDVKGLDDSLKARRADVLATSIETIANADVKHVLMTGLKEANHELNTGPRRMPAVRFAKKRIGAARSQLKKRIRKALHAKQSNYAAYHEVRKAGKKVRYLLEFFEPDISSGMLSKVKRLKRLQKRFGALNDVVASRGLLTSSADALPDDIDAKAALSALKTEQKQRFKAARKAMR
ncbi:CHAD domain-containing protein [Caballeronia calidae]|uniref:CHAD domain-containing protein n=1 Tax=Caballeronia calidae TaxID=1777139 RepID=A0A158EF56_9BURK|nr:CHAD domain-containing protein [Caballeronia calidae]SAL05519.1 CHAD domain-containing protein [Caballeronia calidae]